MQQIPVIDLGRCTECRGCEACAPEIFHYNQETGLMTVADVKEYPYQQVMEAIKNCPECCICWECSSALSTG